MELYIYLLFAGLVFIANIIATITGFGLATILLPALAMVIPAQEALYFSAVIHFANDAYQAFLFRHAAVSWYLIFSFGFPSILATILGAYGAVSIAPEYYSHILGFCIIAYALFVFVRPNWHIQPTTTNAVVGGATSGFTGGLFGLSGIIRSAFMVVFFGSKEAYLLADGLIAGVTDFARLTVYTLKLPLNHALLIAIALSVPIAFLGTYIGKQLVSRLNEKQFKRIVAIALVLMGLKMIIGG